MTPRVTESSLADALQAEAADVPDTTAFLARLHAQRGSPTSRAPQARFTRWSAAAVAAVVVVTVFICTILAVPHGQRSGGGPPLAARSAPATSPQTAPAQTTRPLNLTAPDGTSVTVPFYTLNATPAGATPDGVCSGWSQMGGYSFQPATSATQVKGRMVPDGRFAVGGVLRTLVSTSGLAGATAYAFPVFFTSTSPYASVGGGLTHQSAWVVIVDHGAFKVLGGKAPTPGITQSPAPTYTRSATIVNADTGTDITSWKCRPS